MDSRFNRAHQGMLDHVAKLGKKAKSKKKQQEPLAAAAGKLAVGAAVAVLLCIVRSSA